jgi:hypothetical protein
MTHAYVFYFVTILPHICASHIHITCIYMSVNHTYISRMSHIYKCVCGRSLLILNRICRRSLFMCGRFLLLLSMSVNHTYLSRTYKCSLASASWYICIRALSLHICVCIYTHIHIRVHWRPHHIYIVHMHITHTIYIYICVFICTHTVCVCVYVHTLYVYVYMYTHYMCMCICTHTRSSVDCIRVMHT